MLSLVPSDLTHLARTYASHAPHTLQPSFANSLHTLASSRQQQCINIHAGESAQNELACTGLEVTRVTNMLFHFSPLPSLACSASRTALQERSAFARIFVERAAAMWSDRSVWRNATRLVAALSTLWTSPCQLLHTQHCRHDTNTRAGPGAVRSWTKPQPNLMLRTRLAVR